MSEVRAVGTLLSMLDTKESQNFYHGYSHYKQQKMTELLTIVSLLENQSIVANSEAVQHCSIIALNLTVYLIIIGVMDGGF